MRAYVWLAFISLAAIKTDRPRSRGGSLLGFRDELLPFSPGHEIEGEENDQGQKNPYGPKETAQNRVPPFLRVIKDPNGRDQADQRHEKRKKESHNHSRFLACGFVPRIGVLATCGLGSYFFKLSYQAKFFLINSGIGN